MKTTHGKTGVKAYGSHDTWRNWEHSHNRTNTTHIHIYSYNCTHTDKRRGNWQYLRNYISCGRRHTTTGKICNVDWLHLFLLLLHIGTDQSTPFRAPVHTSTYPTTPSHLPQSQQPGARARASAFCAAVSGSCTSFAALICRSLIYLAIHSNIRVYQSTKSKARPSARPDLWSGRKKCNRWLKSFAGSWNCIEANAFLSVHSMGSLTAYYTYLCHSYANLIRCATEPSSNVDSTYI